MASCAPGGALCADTDPSCDPSYCLLAGPSASFDPSLVPTDPESCHSYCDSTYGSTNPAVWQECVATCGAIPQTSGCGIGNPAACIPNWVPLPGSRATQPVPWSIPAGALALGAIVLLVVLAEGFGQGLAARV
jgi:hypothetical protein